jgi:dynein heavy chain
MSSEEVTRLYTLVETYKVSILPTDLAMFQTLGPTLRQLKEVSDMAMDTKDDNITRFSQELDKAMSDLFSQVSEVRNKAQDPMVLNPTSDSESVMTYLNGLYDQLLAFDASKKRYENWDLLFKSGGFAKDIQIPEGGKAAAPRSVELDESKMEVELKRSLWLSMKEWGVLTE